jgi:hypothetical protein
MLMAPVRVPAAVGVNVTAIAQLPAGATDPPHAFDCAKSPVAAIDASVSGAVPLLASVTD